MKINSYKFQFYFIMLVSLIFAITGRDAMKMKFAGIQLYFLFLIIIVFMLCINLIRVKKINLFFLKVGNGFLLPSAVFITICLVYIILSYLNYITIFNIDYLNMEYKFILRQAYFIFYVVVIVLLAKSLSIYPNLLRNNVSVIGCIYFIICLSLLMPNVGDDRILKIYLYLFFLILYIEQNNKFVKVSLSLITIWILGFDKGTYAIANIICIIFIAYYENVLSKGVKIKNISKLILVIITFSIFLFICLIEFGVVSFIINKDINNVWRLQYWIHELRLLKNTWFLGVGFGTPYGTKELFNHINENAFNVQQDSFGYSQEEKLFIVTQHNSFMNMFYRLGILGGVSFITVHFNILRDAIKHLFSQKINYEKKKLILVTFTFLIINIVDIAFNPGIESPRFFMPYLISMGLMIGIQLNVYLNN